MTILDSFFILFESDASKLDKGLSETDKKADKLIDKLKDVDKEGAKAGEAIFGLLKSGAGLLGVGLSFGALAAGVKATAAEYDELGKLAARFRSTTDAVDDFIDSAGLLGISDEKSIESLKALDTAVQDTYLGMGKAKAIFEDMGISVTDAHGKIKPTTEVMNQLAEKLSKMEKGTQIRIMERLGMDPAMLKLFNSDLSALQQRMGNIDRVSGFNLENAVKRSAEYAKANKNLGIEVNILKMYLEKLIEGFTLSAMPYFTEKLTNAAKYVRLFVNYLMDHTEFVKGFFVVVGSAIAYFLIPSAIRGALAVWAMLAPFMLIGLAIAAVGVAFALLYEDIMTFIDGGDSMIGAILQRWPIIGEVVKAIADEFKSLWHTAEAVAGFLADVWNDPQKAFDEFLQFLLDGIKTLANMIPGLSSLLGAMGIDISGAVGTGKEAIAQATNSPLASQTSNSISNITKGGKNTTVQVGKVEVHTQATDAEGISKTIGGTMQTQMRQAVANFDDGVLA